VKQLEPADRRQLMDIAKWSMVQAVAGGREHRWEQRRARTGAGGARAGATAPEPPESGPLAEHAAAFVTLREGGDLRGCIGLMRFDVSLWQNVADAAAAAALDDPRFYAVTPDELPDIDVEISVLEPPIEIEDPAQFEAGRHGIVIEKGTRRGLLLPQGAPEMGWGNLQMLEAVCQKAHLPAGSWRDPDARLFTFEASCFGEEPAPAPAPATAPAPEGSSAPS
jgi:uncharacterized protein